MKKKLSRNANEKPKYAIVDENGKVLEKFRLKGTAGSMLHNYKDKYISPLRLK